MGFCKAGLSLGCGLFLEQELHSCSLPLPYTSVPSPLEEEDNIIFLCCVLFKIINWKEFHPLPIDSCLSPEFSGPEETPLVSPDLTWATGSSLSTLNCG